MKELHSEIEINASAERVWEVLTDFASYPQWNPFIRRASGTPRTGERLEVRIEPSGSRGMTFRPKVLNAEANHELRWLGHLFVRGLFDGEHSFTIEPLGQTRVRFVQREVFTWCPEFIADQRLMSHNLPHLVLRNYPCREL